MKNIIVVLLLTVSQFALAGPESLTKAGKLMEQRRFDDAWLELYKNINTVDAPNKDAATFTLGSIFHNDAILYQALYKAAMASERSYVDMLMKDKSKNKSQLAPIAAAMLDFESGDCAKVSASLGKLGQVDKGSPAVHLKNLYITACQFIKKGKFESFIDENKNSMDALLGSLAIAAERGKSKEALAYLEKKALKEDQLLKEANILGLSGYITILRQGGKMDEALRVASIADKTKFLIKEESKAGRVIVFYAPYLLKELSALYSDASVFYFSKLTRAGKYEAMGNYLAAERSLYTGDIKTSIKILDEILGKGKLPPRLEERATTTSKIAKAYIVKKSEADKVAVEMVSTAGDRYDVMADALWSCMLVSGLCEKASNVVNKKAETADRKRGKPMMLEVGKFLESDKKHTQAIAMMEAVRDKANKNKIEYNDPLMFISLAEAYRNTKNYSENLEIYFEISKYYPAVRVIQDSVQGVYSVEQKSAGDVKIF